MYSINSVNKKILFLTNINAVSEYVLLYVHDRQLTVKILDGPTVIASIGLSSSRATDYSLFLTVTDVVKPTV